MPNNTNPTDTGTSPSARHEKLVAFRQGLRDLTPWPWSNVQFWISEVSPLIQVQYPEVMSLFRDVAKDPQFDLPTLPVDPNGSGYHAVKAAAGGENHMLAIEAKVKILRFLDGLLDLEPLGPPPSPNASNYTVNINAPIGGVAVGSGAKADGMVSVGDSKAGS